MLGGWTVLRVLSVARQQVELGAGEGALAVIRSLRGEVPAPVRDLAYYSLMDAAAVGGERASMGLLTQHREATLALIDAAIARLTAKLN
jgi:hypothetical protein